ncbi:uncharacterized protein GGS25DRAFT_503571 [Hypoxylon fragiforme]|uniref:uncharacterized protein n=1 Tax=Hypoxylon fragiforme TaxID=63214 RepID=UPI0020C73DA3|nr:uncharacterized protein GGS25DRAFT_503571 [Hypoxylon fragiforme]KAI2605109.1 hypothetical protein GGS25DRAFT_503571 [Hypoxylon fragiforme]
MDGRWLINQPSHGDLKRQLSELQDHTDKTQLEKASQLLGVNPLPDDDRHCNLAEHQANVAAEFGQKNWYTEGTLKERCRSVKGTSAYRKWLQSSESVVLVLLGTNQENQARHCWVSPVGFSVISKFTQSETLQGSNLCVFYLLGLRNEDDTWSEVLAFLIYRQTLRIE